MNKFTNPLENIRIASPCSADWNQMIGSERQRFCGDCKLNVYNLSGMTRGEAENLLIQSEGRLCVRFYKRADGTVLTKDCPVGWQALKRRVSKTATAFVSLIFAFMSAVGINSYFNRAEERETLMGEMVVEPISENNLSLNDVVKAPVIKPVKEEEIYVTSGVVSNINEVRQQVKKKHRR